MDMYYQIRENGIPFGFYWNGRDSWVRESGKKTYKNITMCCTDAAMLSKRKSVVVVKRMLLPNGKWKELPIKVFSKK